MTTMKTILITLPLPTPDGVFIAHYTERGLAELDFPAAKKNCPAPVASKVPRLISQWHRVTAAALQSALAGRGVKKLPPLDWAGTTEFQQAVWREMLKIAPGRTKSYGEIAAAIGRPKAVRAVGGACGANPVPVLVPCHRILAANRKIGGFSGGLDRKRRLLEREGVVL